MSRRPTLRQRLEELVSDMVAKGIQLDEALEQLERQFLVEVLRGTNGNCSRAAARLRMHRNTLRRKLERYGLR